MVHLDLARTTVVFDLDDTLYPEADYAESGMRYVCARLQNLSGKDIYALVRAETQAGRRDWLAVACERAGLPVSAKESLLWMYRLHLPHIRLDLVCEQVLHRIRERALAVAVLTDGRSVTQRLKLMALGLGDWPVYISEDYGSEKPSPVRFKAIEASHTADHYVYVGDNVKKDFLGCNRLGWISIGMRAGPRNIHSQVTDGLLAEALPTHWVDGWGELLKLLGEGPRDA